MTFQATWSLANTPIVVFITVIFSSIVFSCSVLCNSAFFSFFYSRAAVSVVFPPCCPVQVLSCAVCLHHVFLSEQIKMMMMMMMIIIIIINDRRIYPAVSKASRTGNKVSCQPNDCPNRWVFKRRLKMASDGTETMSAGRSFQTRGATAPKARSPIVRSRVRRTSSFWVVADRSRLRESSVSAHCRSLAR